MTNMYHESRKKKRPQFYPLTGQVYHITVLISTKIFTQEHEGTPYT